MSHNDILSLLDTAISQTLKITPSERVAVLTAMGEGLIREEFYYKERALQNQRADRIAKLSETINSITNP